MFLIMTFIIGTGALIAFAKDKDFLQVMSEYIKKRIKNTK